MLSGCDVNLGTLSSDQIQVFGAYDSDCGDTRKYFFYLEFRASVAASASGVGFTPNIELRPGSASDSATPTAQSRGNPADFYQSVTSGSYRINLENITAGDTYNLSLQAFGLPPPTRTPIPTPTPRFQPNVDVRLDPDPRGVAYEDNEVYRFRVEGGAGSFPALIRSSNATAVRVTGSSGSTLDCTAAAQVDDLDQLDRYLRPRLRRRRQLDAGDHQAGRLFAAGPVPDIRRRRTGSGAWRGRRPSRLWCPG